MIFRKVSSTAPGPDGLPYTAWKSAGVYGRIVLLGITDWMMQGLCMPLAFGDSLLICIGKVGEQIIGRGNAPKASRTRPLCLRNTDAKSVAAVVAHCLTPGQKSHVVDTANGFVAERQLVSNAVAIDTYARIHSWH